MKTVQSLGLTLKKLCNKTADNLRCRSNNQCHLLVFFLSLCPGSWVWRPSPIPGSLMRLGTWPPTVCMIWLWGQQTTKRHVPPLTNLHTKLSWPVFSLFLNKHLFHFSLTRCVQPAARTSTTVQDTWDTWSSLCPCTTRCFSMWAAVCTTHTAQHSHVPHSFPANWD